jgi:Tol biopolymer transport system component
MGQVFRARDSRLSRDVALKVLPEIFARDENRRARFSQEARAAGALNHPGIVAVYDIGFEDGTFYMVTELVEGPTLRALMEEGRIPHRRMIDLSMQVAEALAAAHTAGITHRDLKPENIMVNQEGRAKILDFGLAKHGAPAPIASAEGPTATVAITQEGAVLGTMGYMAPEQIRGKPADARTDIFSLGLVMYEMLSGLRAFQRDTSADSISALLREDPADLPPATPSGLVQIVNRCLEKEPARRFQSASDLAFSLRSLSAGGNMTKQHAAVRFRSRNWLPWTLAAVGLAIGAAGWWSRPRSAPPFYDLFPITSFAGVESHPALSPDGKQLAFVWAGEPADASGVYVKIVSGGAPPIRVSPAGKSADSPRWSPDGSRLVYMGSEGANRVIVIAPALGGPERRVMQGWARAPFGGVDWSPDGKWLLASLGIESGRQLLRMISVETGESHVLVDTPEDLLDYAARFSPDGRQISFIRGTFRFRSIFYTMTIGADGKPAGTPRRVGQRVWAAASADWSADGKSLIAPVSSGSNRRYWRIPIDGGDASRLPLQFPDSLGPALSAVSIRANRMAITVNSSQQSIGRIVWNEVGNRWENAVFYESSQSDEEPQASPTGEQVAFCSTRSGNRELWRARPDGSGAMQLTNAGERRVGSPRWSADGRWIAFDSSLDPRPDIFVVSAEGGKARQVTSPPGNYVRPSFSADGQWIYSTDRGHLVRSPFGGGTPEAVSETNLQEGYSSFDGRWIYYKQTPNFDLFRSALSGGVAASAVQARYHVPNAIAWALGATHLYFIARQGEEPARIVSVEPESGKEQEIYRLPAERSSINTLQPALSVSRDERTIYYQYRKRLEQDIVMVEPFR